METCTCFHSTKEGFKGYGNRTIPSSRGRVSIPPRKVSRSGPPGRIGGRSPVSIPPRKVSRHERACREGDGEGVSIPPRKVSRLRAWHCDKQKLPGFHSTKEGFKVFSQLDIHYPGNLFPFHQGRFQGRVCTMWTWGYILVSIPPRKVSRGGSVRHCGNLLNVSIPPRKVSRIRRI